MDTRTLYVIVVLVSALLVAFESVSIEGAVNIADLDIFLVSSLPLVVGGLVLVATCPRRTADFVRSLDRRGGTFVTALCAFIALGVILWFDSVSRIGASKEAILGGGSSEVLFVVILSAVFLGERLKRIEVLGSFLIIAGVFIVLANAEKLSLTLGLGEMEAIMSSLSLGVSVVMTAVLLKEHPLTPLSGFELLISGLLLVGFGTVSGLIQWPDSQGFLILLALGFFPATGLLAYNAGLPKIGASLTSVLFALSGIMTVGVQLLVLEVFPDADMILPRSVPLAIAGGLVAFVGVYLLNIDPTSEEARPAPGLAEKVKGIRRKGP